MNNADDPIAATIGDKDLFFGFMKIGSMGFGGHRMGRRHLFHIK